MIELCEEVLPDLPIEIVCTVEPLFNVMSKEFHFVKVIK